MRLACGLALAAAILTAAPATAAAPKPRRVPIADNYYAPARLTVERGTRITWRWPEEAGDVHDVRLRSGPKGVRRFRSEPAASGYSFRRTLRAPGRYQIVCSFHQYMAMTLRVRR